MQAVTRRLSTIGEGISDQIPALKKLNPSDQTKQKSAEAAVNVVENTVQGFFAGGIARWYLQSSQSQSMITGIASYLGVATESAVGKTLGAPIVVAGALGGFTNSALKTAGVEAKVRYPVSVTVAFGTALFFGATFPEAAVATVSYYGIYKGWKWLKATANPNNLPKAAVQVQPSSEGKKVE